MTDEQETNHAFARSRSNAELGLLPRIEAHIRQLSPHMIERDGVMLLKEAMKEIDSLHILIGDIKAWDVANYMTLPYDLRVRIQETLMVPNVEVRGCGAETEK